MNCCAPQNVKVVIIGQDPYHGLGEANGLAFSVNKGVKIPPSLRNIFLEIHRDLNIPAPQHGDLSFWAKQGVLLLNTCLTVRKDAPASHQNKGWEQFTDAIIRSLNHNNNHLVFLLWGNFAKNKSSMIDKEKHLVLETSHPSPFSAHKGFIGCGHFSATNVYLTSKQIIPIDWKLN